MDGTLGKKIPLFEFAHKSQPMHKMIGLCAYRGLGSQICGSYIHLRDARLWPVCNFFLTVDILDAQKFLHVDKGKFIKITWRWIFQNSKY